MYIHVIPCVTDDSTGVVNSINASTGVTNDTDDSTYVYD